MHSWLELTWHTARIVWVFYRFRRDTGRYLSDDGVTGSINYGRILCLGLLDALITFPIAVANITLQVKANIQIFGTIPFYYGWSTVHEPGWSQPLIERDDEDAALTRGREAQSDEPRSVSEDSRTGARGALNRRGAPNPRVIHSAYRGFMLLRE